MALFNCRHSLEPVDEKLIQEDAINKLNKLETIIPGQVKSPLKYTPINLKTKLDYKKMLKKWKEMGCL